MLPILKVYMSSKITFIYNWKLIAWIYCKVHYFNSVKTELYRLIQQMNQNKNVHLSLNASMVLMYINTFFEDN